MNKKLYLKLCKECHEHDTCKSLCEDAIKFEAPDKDWYQVKKPVKDERRDDRGSGGISRFN